MNDIDKMVQQLLDSLGMTSENYEEVLFRAINVASFQLDYANHQVGVVVKELKALPPDLPVKAGLSRFIADEVMRDAEMSIFLRLRKELSQRKRYAKRLGLGLDQLVKMWQAVSHAQV